MTDRSALLWRSAWALGVVGFALFALLYVNGHFPLDVAIGISVALGAAVFLSTRPRHGSKRGARKS